MTELEKDLDGLGGLGRVYYNGVGVSLDCCLCPLYDEPRCNSSGGCKEGILQYIAARLDELGYVKVDAVKEQIVSSFKEWRANYPESVFLPRPVGEHSPTFDGCAGRAMRAMLPAIEKSLLRDIDEWAKETCRSAGKRVEKEVRNGR